MRRGPEVLVRIKIRPKNGLGHGHAWGQAGWARGTQPFSLRQVIQHTAQIGVGFMAQGVRMPFAPIFAYQLVVGVHDNVGGYEPNPYTASNSWNTEAWSTT